MKVHCFTADYLQKMHKRTKVIMLFFENFIHLRHLFQFTRYMYSQISPDVSFTFRYWRRDRWSDACLGFAFDTWISVLQRHLLHIQTRRTTKVPLPLRTPWLCDVHHLYLFHHQRSRQHPTNLWRVFQDQRSGSGAHVSGLGEFYWR